jgi:hypothetical protein
MLCCMQYILNEGVFPSPRDAHGVTPLQLACLKGHPTCVSALLEGGADPHMTDVDGDSALHWAGQGGNEKVPTSYRSRKVCTRLAILSNSTDCKDVQFVAACAKYLDVQFVAVCCRPCSSFLMRVQMCTRLTRVVGLHYIVRPSEIGLLQ